MPAAFGRSVDSPPQYVRPKPRQLSGMTARVQVERGDRSGQDTQFLDGTQHFNETMAVWGESRLDSSHMNARANSFSYEDQRSIKATSREQSHHEHERQISLNAPHQAEGRDHGANYLETRGGHSNGESNQDKSRATRAHGAGRQDVADTVEPQQKSDQNGPGRPSEERLPLSKEHLRSQVPDLSSAMQHSWDNIGQAVHRLDDDLEHCSKLLASATAPTVSMATRKKLLEKGLDEAERARSHAQVLSTHLSDLQYVSLEMSVRHADAMEERDAMVRQVERMAADMEELGARLSSAQRSDDGKSGAVASLQARVETSEARVQSLTQALRACEVALQAARTDVEATSKANAELRESNAALQQAAQEAKRAEERENERAQVCQRVASDAQQTIERQKAALAKVTGDNMVFIIKLNAATEELEARNAEVAALQAQIDSRCGDWIRRAREQVAQTMQGSLEKVDELEKALANASKLRGTLEERVAQADAARAAAQEERGEVEARVAELEERLASATREQVAADARAQEETRKADHARAEVLVMSETLAAARVEVVHLSMKLEASGAELKACRNELSSAREQLAAAVARIQSANEATRHEQRVNAVLMRKKEEVEWELLALQAATAQHAPAAVDPPGAKPGVASGTTRDVRSGVPPRLSRSTPPSNTVQPAENLHAGVGATSMPASEFREEAGGAAPVVRAGHDQGNHQRRADASDVDPASPRVSPRDAPSSSHESDMPQEDGSGAELPVSWIDASTISHGDVMGDREGAGPEGGYVAGLGTGRSWMVVSTDIRKNQCL